jgi:glycosyltransferase involved in cell wall biosynthesis
VGESNARVVPFISGLTGAPHAGAGVADVYESLRAALKEVGRSPRSKADANGACLVMRQHLFCNISLSHVMFELTNSLLELGVPTIPQAQQGDLTPSHIVLEEELYRTGTGDKYERVFKHVHTDYDPEKAITLHFTMLKMGGAYPALSGREALYVTGNAQGASRESVRQLTSSFEKILGVSPFVLWPFVQAGLGSTQAAIIPHGVDPELFNPERRPTAYPTKKRFKFLETSFPWINEKGFDLTIRAFGQAFSSTDDVCLMLRVPCVTDLSKRKQTFDRLETLVRDELSKPRAPEILLVESNVELDRRGGIYTAADCYVHPSRSEGFGMTILEAMACGLPVISTAWAGPAEFVSARWAYPVRHSPPPSQATGNGTWRCMPVEPELDHLVYLMRHVYSHRNEAKALGRKAAAVVRDRWTWKHAAIKLAELFSLPYSSQPSVNNYTGPPT